MEAEHQFFVRQGTAWSKQAKIAPNDPVELADFGRKVSIAGDTILVGATGAGEAGLWSGAVYVFVRQGTVWTQQAKLMASDADPWDVFGSAVSLSGDVALIGAPGSGSKAGAAYIFARNGTTWTQEAKLVGGDPALNGEFGYSVAVSGTTAVVGAPRVYSLASSYSGAAFVFERQGASWVDRGKLIDPAPENLGEFGLEVNVSGNTVIVGVPKRDGVDLATGVVYVYQRQGVSYPRQSTIEASDAAMGDYFGSALGLAENELIVGAAYADRPNPGDFPIKDNGAAYIYPLTTVATKKSNGTGCSKDDECHSLFCADSVCCDQACGADVADCRACTLTLTGVASGTCAFTKAGTLCRAGSGDICDQDEVCSGSHAECPGDNFASSGTICRAPADACDAAETCDGSGGPCPKDTIEPDGTPCNGDGTCEIGYCISKGSGGAGASDGAGGGDATGAASSVGATGGTGPGLSFGGDTGTGAVTGAGSPGYDGAGSNEADPETGCSCTMPGNRSSSAVPQAMLCLLAAASIFLRRRVRCHLHRQPGLDPVLTGDLDAVWDPDRWSWLGP